MSHPDDGKLDDSYAALTEATRRRQRSGIVEMSFVAAAAVLIAVSALFNAWNTFELRKINQAAAESRRLTMLGTECLVQQLAAQRQQSALAHQAEAAHLGYPYPLLPESAPPVVPETLEKACAAFITSTTTTR